MVLVHTVLFKFKPDGSSEHKEIRPGAQRSPGSAERSEPTACCGRPFSDRSYRAQPGLPSGVGELSPGSRGPSGVRFVQTSERGNEQKELPRYQASEEHNRITSTYLWPFKEEVTRFDFETDAGDEQFVKTLS
ncbi:hypothetical protein ED733_001705 [Metarhizium rileyi]|uniref:Uncharacterized protein n=1 Tax=Metarhizium rileyi (strain RCEF 4871) TaxID=1649241 RepID=A0A5C6GE86_METRR|nr:hypothetical protein ED733_001705 [Metarhizium rileyi]